MAEDDTGDGEGGLRDVVVVLCRIQGMRRAGEGGVAGYAIGADEEGGGGDDDEELQHAALSSV